MTRPKIRLQEWLNTEQKLKLQFIEHELNPSNTSGLLMNLVNNNESIYISDRIQSNPLTEKSMLNSMHIAISEFCFDKLKQKYRTFKNKGKDSFLIKKQYKLSKETVKSIKEIKNEYNFPREEYVIENIINGHINNKNIKQKIEKLKPKEIDFEALNFIINENKKEIDGLKNEKNNLEFKINKIINLLAISSLENEYLKDVLQDQDIFSEHSTPSEEKIKNKILELNNLLEES